MPRASARAAAAQRAASGAAGGVAKPDGHSGSVGKGKTTTKAKTKAKAKAKAKGKGESKATREALAPRARKQLLSLGPLEEGVLVCRPSARNRSPYVADVRLTSGEHAGRTAVVHAPSLDMGGKFLPGTRVLCRRQPGVTPDTLGKHGTPKCELITQLMWLDGGDEDEGSKGVWIGAHPALGEKLAAALLASGAFNERLRAPVAEGGISSQVMRPATLPGAADGERFRPDFELQHVGGGPTTIMEVKHVVDSDYGEEAAERRAVLQAPHPVYVGDAARRAGIFPWGKLMQKGPDGEGVVSARAIKHLREATAAAQRGESAAVAFIVGRGDAVAFRANGAACPSFARYLADAEEAGVRVLAHGVTWGEGDEVGVAFDSGPLEVAPPLEGGAVRKVTTPKNTPSKPRKPRGEA